MSSAKRNIFVLGYDEFHGADMARIPDVEKFHFRPLLHADEVVYQKEYDIRGILDKACRILRDFDGPVDAIITHWDFPAATIAAMLCREFKLYGPSPEALLKCSHKYWSRLEQRKAAPESTPAFCAFNPFDEDPMAAIDMDFPYWIKPVKAYGSALGFLIENRQDFDDALAEIRDKIPRLGSAVDDLMGMLDLPEEIRGIGGRWFIAEELMSGEEFAPEGCVRHGEVEIHGGIDMVFAESGTSFARYQYPSSTPEAVQQRAAEIITKVLSQIGFDNGCFNVEFFWHRDSDRLRIIEINPRISQSHSYQFEMVDGMSNHEIAIHVALGDEPGFHHGSGPYTHAAKCLLRRYDIENAVVRAVPTAEEIERVEKEVADTRVNLMVEQGQRLSQVLDRDSYSYLLAEVFVAGHSREELTEKYDRAAEMLRFELTPVEK